MSIYMDSKIDAEIAVRIMGWKKDEERTQRWDTGNSLLHESHWRPTYNISDAWAVVNKLQKIGDFLIAKDYDDNEWEAELTIWKNGSVDRHFYSRHESPQMAISLLALKAMNE